MDEQSGFHDGISRSSADARPKAPATGEPRVIYMLRVFSSDPPEMSRAIESQKIRRALTLAAQNFGAHNGKQLAAKISDGYSIDDEAPIIIADYEDTPNAPP